MPRRRPPAQTAPSNRTSELIKRIEAIIAEGIAEPLSRDPPRPLSLPLCTRKRSSREVMVAASITFPGRTEAEARKFNQILHLLKSTHIALRTGKVLTKRNLYYEETELYGSQARVDQLVDDLAVTLGVGRHDLGIVAAGKGVISGPVKMRLQGSGVVDAAQSLEGSIIPPSNAIRGIELGPTRWVLVIEKEATFRTLSTTKYWERSAAGQGLLVTGKGYPDLATRSFLHEVHNTRPAIPIYALVDYDPDGVNVFRCYKWGSAALEHEEGVKLPSLQWLGIKSRDLNDMPSQVQVAAPVDYDKHAQVGVSSRKQTIAPVGPFNRLLRLTQRDSKLTIKLLGDLGNETDRGGDAAEAVLELQKMLMMNIKAEIQTMNDEGDITCYLERMLVEGSRQVPLPS